MLTKHVDSWHVGRTETKTDTDGDPESWKWKLVSLLHWVVGVTSFAYAVWNFATDDTNAFLQQEKPRGFRRSPYGLQREQDDTNWEWISTRSVVTSNWKWFILHPLLGRATAGIAPSLAPVFYAVYTSLFVAVRLGWEVALAFLGQHAAFLALAAVRVPAFCYVLALLMIVQKHFFERTFFHYVYKNYGYEAHILTYIAFHWNILRCLSFSVDLIRAERSKPEESRTKWPPYWKTLAYVIYMPTVYLGPLQNYDDYSAQIDKPRPPCTPREVGAAILGVLRSAVHFLLMEVMTHYLYSSAMSEWSWMVGKLDPTSLVGFGLALLFFFYVHYTFAYGFAGALARAEGIEIPPHPKCIARLNRCSQFWRYFDRGMQLFIRRYFYEPVVGKRKDAGWLLLGAATSFAFTWFWHDMKKADGIFCALSLLGIALEVLVAEVRKLAFAKAREIRDRSPVVGRAVSIGIKPNQTEPNRLLLGGRVGTWRRLDECERPERCWAPRTTCSPSALACST
ncbi:protein-cysteine N-palmitoyltransferase Rasp-like isoform X2 [Dermacentor variabilis]|uniref:protein-cysteine N-palmitoyltransferase Rasp-like isoform X2 n=1 Tax=Dermacentor variabilis TaxID=34621 RepID=UPI003F5C5CBE